MKIMVKQLFKFYIFITMYLIINFQNFFDTFHDNFNRSKTYALYDLLEGVKRPVKNQTHFDLHFVGKTCSTKCFFDINNK